VMMNLGNPDAAFGLAMVPNDVSGLPGWSSSSAVTSKSTRWRWSTPERVTDEAVRRSIADLTYGYPNGEEYFVERLAEGAGPSPRRSTRTRSSSG